MKKASGFYADSLEMLLDTMCNVLGGIVFITLTLAQLVRHSPATNPEYEQREAARLANDLASVTASNTVVEAELVQLAQELQAPHASQTNLMSLPNASQTDRKRWTVIVRYGRLYPLSTLTTGAAGQSKNTSTVTWRGQSVEPKLGQGDEPEEGISRMVEAFKRSSRTNYQFDFWVYDDSFPEFNRAKETAVKLGFHYGWEPLPRKAELSVDSRAGERIPSQN